MTNEEAQIVIGNIPLHPEVLDDSYSITEYQEAKAMAIEALDQEPMWIPITKRPMTEDEKQWHESCYDEAEILNCPLPEDGEDVLITVNGRTWIDTFLRDETDGCYFESYDIDEVEAWMPLPEPYKEESEDEG